MTNLIEEDLLHELELLIHAKTTDEFQLLYSHLEDYPLGEVGSEKALRMISGRWKYVIMMRIIKRPMHFSELKISLEEDGILDSNLSRTLNELMADNLVSKEIYLEGSRSRTKYSATQKCIELWMSLIRLSYWYNKYQLEEKQQKN